MMTTQDPVPKKTPKIWQCPKCGGLTRLTHQLLGRCLTKAEVAEQHSSKNPMFLAISTMVSHKIKLSRN